MGGWAMVGLHVFKQTEIFMYVRLCRCVRAPSRVPLLGLCIRMCDCGVKNTSACKDCMSICVLLCASVHMRRFLPGDA